MFLADKINKAADGISSQMKLFLYNLSVRVFKARSSTARWVNTITNYAGLFAGTIIGLLATSFLFTPYSQNIATNFDNLNTVFIAIGGIIGTMFALALSLSIIPIQRAAEIFTPSIIRLYKNDRVTLLIFVLLTLFCITSFILSIDGILPLGTEKLFPFGILFIACSLDLLRWHHRHVSELLTPNFAINRLLKISIKYIAQFQCQISRLGRIQYKLLPEDQKEEKGCELIEAALYGIHSYHVDFLKNWADEVSEIAHKAVSRGETNTATSGINALAIIAQTYLVTRKDNLILMPSQVAFMAIESDVDSMMNPIYEHLQDINQQSVTLQNESVGILIIKALERIASFSTNLKARAFRDNSAPLTFMPIYYLKECIKFAQQKNMIDMPLQASKSLLIISVSAPKNMDMSDVHIPIIDSWFEIVQGYYIYGKGRLVNTVLTDMMRMLRHLLKQEHFQYRYILKEILSKLEGVVRFALASELFKGDMPTGLSLAPYDTTNQASFAYLVQEAASLIKREDGKEWVNPYRDFMKINESLYRHFRNLAENIDFGGSFLLWHITQTIKEIVRVYLKLIYEPITDNPIHINELARKVPWYLAFFWVTFSKTKKFNFKHAEEACDVMAWVGLAFYERGYKKEVSEICVKNIVSIIEAYSQPNNFGNSYDMADLYMFIWKFRILADSKSDKYFVREIDGYFTKKLDTLSEEKWKDLLNKIELRKEQLQERLDEYEPYEMGRVKDDAESLLKRFIEGEA